MYEEQMFWGAILVSTRRGGQSFAGRFSVNVCWLLHATPIVVQST
jgi:hypothetical protein